jgi:hypothetical protein
MEVHHHPEVGKKSFKEYLLEGLMIFLAVTMGFFAESYREHINNKEKERSYIISLVNNLKDDTANMNVAIRVNQKKMKGLDTLLMLSSSDMTSPSDRKLLYGSLGNISEYSQYGSNDAAMMQLKYSGGLQYIRRDHVADSIAAYDQLTRSIATAEAPYDKSINDAIDAMGELLVFTEKKDSAVYTGRDRPDKQFPLLTNDPKTLKIFFNKVYLERGWTVNYIRNLKKGIPVTISLIELLKKEYDLD